MWVGNCLVGSNPTLSASLRSSSFGWLTPEASQSEIRAKLPAEALAKEGWFRKRPMFYVYLIRSEEHPEQR